ncbi:MAG: hypothetical protein JW760_06050 [Spirochaetales bacterium]|nr:hypothetical protein [Spirochaetales bacterium]
MIADWLMGVMSNLVMSHLISLLLLVGLNYYIWLQAGRTVLMKSYLALSLGPFLWIVGKLFKTVAPTIGLRWTFIMVQYLGMSILGPAFVVFCLTYLLKRRPSSFLLTALFLPTTILYLLVLTNPLHHWFYPVFTFYRDSFGPVFYILKYVLYGCTASGFVLLVIALFKHRRKHVIQSILFILAALVPLAGSFYYPNLGNKFSNLRFDIIPLCFNATFLFFGIAVFRYDFLDISPIARRQVLDALEEGVRIRDAGGIVLYSNRSADDAFSSEHNGQYRIGEYTIPGKHHGPSLSMELLIDVSAENQRKNSIKERTDILRRLAQEEEESIRQEREILFMRQRNFAAQEIHDILGHSLTLFIARLEALKILDESGDLPRKLEEAFSRFSRWKDDLSSTLSEKPHFEETESVLLSEWLNLLIQPCKDIVCTVELIIRGTEKPLRVDTVRQVFAAVRESLTNSLRHGRADHVVISVSFDTQCRIVIMDNGIGCGNVQEGNGLDGIRKRLESLKGTVAFASSRDEGFISRLNFHAY